MSPEIVNAEQYSLKSDIWSLGCIIYELCALNPPFDAKTHLSLCQKIKAGRYPDIPSNYSCHLKEAIGQCLKVHPDRRPDTAGLLNLSGLRLASMQRSARVKEHELQVREQALAAREKALSRQALQAEAQKKSIENSVNAQLHREWEVKANLAITENTNARLKELEREFEMRLHNRVGLEVARRLQQLQVAKLEFTGSTSPVRARHPVAMTRSREDYDVTGEDDCPSMTYLSSVSLESPVSRRVSSRMQRTPFVEKARLLEIQSPMDIEMTEASPMVTIPSLALSPRRKSGASRLAPIGRNIFAEAAGPKQNIDPADHALPESDEEEYTDDARPSEEGSLEDDKSPTFLIPAMKTRKEDPFTSDPAKKVSSRPSLGARQQTMPSRVMVASRHQLNAPTITGNPPPHRANHFSTLEAPVRRREPLSTLPVANRTNILPPSMQLQTEPQNPTSPNRSRGGLKSKALHHGGDAMLRAVTTHNLMKENVSTSNQCATVTKRTTMVNPSSPERRLAGGAIGLASRMLGDAGSDTTPPVWDLEDVDCPSPFLKRQRSAISRVSAWVE